MAIHDHLLSLATSYSSLLARPLRINPNFPHCLPTIILDPLPTQHALPDGGVEQPLPASASHHLLMALLQAPAVIHDQRSTPVEQEKCAHPKVAIHIPSPSRPHQFPPPEPVSSVLPINILLPSLLFCSPLPAARTHMPILPPPLSW